MEPWQRSLWEKMAPKLKAEPRKESLRVRNCEYLYKHKTWERVIYLNIKLIIFNKGAAKISRATEEKMQAKCVLDNTISKNKENDGT